MDTQNKEYLLEFRKEYEQSGLSASAFAKSKDMEYWKVQYALRKALRFKNNYSSRKLNFKKLVPKTTPALNKEIRIKTSYGAEIIIPL